MSALSYEWQNLPSVRKSFSHAELGEISHFLSKYPNVDVKYKVAVGEPDFSGEQKEGTDLDDVVYECGEGESIFVQVQLYRPWSDQDFVPSGKKYSLLPMPVSTVQKEDEAMSTDDGAKEWGDYYKDNKYGEHSPTRREESGWIVLGYEKTLLAIKKLPAASWTRTQNEEDGRDVAMMKMVVEGVAPNSSKQVVLKLYVVSDAWMGSDQEFKLKFNIHKQ